MDSILTNMCCIIQNKLLNNLGHIRLTLAIPKMEKHEIAELESWIDSMCRYRLEDMGFDLVLRKYKHKDSVLFFRYDKVYYSERIDRKLLFPSDKKTGLMICIEIWMKMAELCKRAFGYRTEWHAFALNQLGITLMYDNQNRRALQYFLESLEIRKHLWGENELTAIVYNNVGCAYGADGERETGHPYLLKALDIRQRILGDHTDTAESYSNIANNLYNMNRNEEALVYARKSIAMRNRIGEDFEMAYSLNSLALIYNNLGDKSRAVSFLDKAIRILNEYGWTESMEIQTMKENRNKMGVIISSP